MSRPPVLTWLQHSEFLLIEFLESTLSPERNLPIYFNNHYKGPLPEKVYYYNIEQLTRKSELETIKGLWAKGHIVEVWDYSTFNCKILTENNIPNRYVPFTPTPKRIEYYNELLQQPKIYDVGFCGASSPRRDFVLKGLRDAGLTVLALHNAWGEERDKQLARSKVIVNIHYGNDYKVFETSRCGHWLAVGHPVISEESLDSDSRAITVPYDKLIERTIQALKEQKGSVLHFCACFKCSQPWTG
jgi:hypothetical protein